jgi:single-strand DNA-binding protein
MSAPAASKKPAQDQQATTPGASPRETLGDGHVSGNLTADPELRYTPTGRAVCRLRVAYTPRVLDPDTGRWSDGATEFYSLDAWGQQGENCAENLQRGDRIVACGQWQRRTYEDADGNSRSVIEMQVRDLGPSLLFRGARIIRSQRPGATAPGLDSHPLPPPDDRDAPEDVPL